MSRRCCRSLLQKSTAEDMKDEGCVQSDRKMIITKLFRGFGCVRRKKHWGLPLTGRLVNTATGSEHCVKGRFYAGNIFQARGQLVLNGCERCFVYPSVQNDMVCVTSGILPHVQNCKGLVRNMSKREDLTPQPENRADEKKVEFHGPLMSGKMQKDELLRFIQWKCQESFCHLNDSDQQIFYFFWLIMELFLKPTETRVMTAEIAAVLFKGCSSVRRKLGCVHLVWCISLTKLLCSSAKEDEKRKAVVKLGDEFVSRGWTYAGQICYVVAQMELGSRKSFELIGCEENKNRPVPKDVLERTEVYEYVLSQTSGFGQPHFQLFKYTYAFTLAKAGVSDQALDYCEGTARSIITMPRYVDSFLTERIIKLSNELLQEEAEKSEWLLKLCRLLRVVCTPSSEGSGDQELPRSVEEFQEELDSRYTVGELLGKGAFGAVYAGVCKADGRSVALKYVTKTIKESFPGTKPREVELLEMVSKPPRCEYVVELLEWLDVSTSFILVLERPSPCIDLRGFLQMNKNNLLSEHEVREIMWQVLLAASHCTDRNVFHGDLQSKNFLLNTDTMKVKLIDFGCGYLVSDFYTSSTGHITSLWSLGLLMVELICGTINFDSTDQMINTCSQFVSAECVKLLTMSLKKNTNAPTYKEIMRHSWFKKRHSPVSQAPPS
ncbi:uncharacterized protein LOC113634797 isoform X2 [Tachysurus fulvidraco]|uniref:uncharacterized protein LOC113634797 isoform X2 n=1 Tax=Tachysurus fulvidraco TaxID=1234273 RepID=UPI001FEFC579|nr:uncharacterized protein LOC113634797 isoform X2 [Tachysurus fulvidraco]